MTSSHLSEFVKLSSSTHEVWARVMGSTLKDDFAYVIGSAYNTFPFVGSGKCEDQLKKIGKNYVNHRSATMTATDLGLTKTYNRFHDLHDHKPDIIELRRLHAQMDDAVLRAYGWDDLADLCAPGGEAAPRFLHGTDEPEFAYQKRYHWPAWFRDKVLARLLELNRERAAAQKTPEIDTRDDGQKLKPKKKQLDIKGPLL